MYYDFLKDFPRRMKNVGLYATLIQNIILKTSWNKYYMVKADEQINVVFSVLLFIMEKSLRDDFCTLDDIAVFLDDLNSSYYLKPLSFDECRTMGDFIVNAILSNDGKIMQFDGYDYDQKAYHIVNIRYVMNKVVYIDGDVRRTSYLLTEDGYNLLLSTLEVENNLRFTIQEMIFRLHLEKQSYDKAAQDIRELFNQMRIQLRKIDAAMINIRRNALSFSVTQYEEILNENMDMVMDTKSKFENYRELVEERRAELEEIHFNIQKLSREDEEKLANLKIISGYLSQTIDEHQKILSSHFDLKDLYTRELENLSIVSMVKRFPLRTEVYDEILKDPGSLDRLHYFLSPLFNQDVEQIYNPSAALTLQRPARKKREEDTTEDIDFDEQAWEAEQERKRAQAEKRYAGCLSFLLERAIENEEVTLEEIEKEISEDDAKKEQLIPSIGVFKEVMVELIKYRVLDIAALQEERRSSFGDSSAVFEVNRMVLDLLEQMDSEKSIAHILIEKEGEKKIVFSGIADGEGRMKELRCSNVRITVRME